MKLVSILFVVVALGNGSRVATIERQTAGRIGTEGTDR